jgi:hypothetical protein
MTLASDDAFRATLRAMRGEVALVVCEMTVGYRWPDYVERQLIRDTILSGGGQPSMGGRFEVRRTIGGVGENRVILVFTDCAHSRYLWTWKQLASRGPLRYLEFLQPESETALASALPGYLAATRAPPPSTVSSRGVASLLRMMVARIPMRCGRPKPELDELVRWCQESAEPAGVRACWRVLARLRVVDPRCGEGDWLIEAAETLEAIYLASLDRMRSWLQDGTAPASGRRRRLEDFRALLAGFEDRSESPSIEVRVRREIVRRNLFGWDDRRRPLSRCRRRLREYAVSIEGNRHRDVNARLCPAAVRPAGPLRWNRAEEDTSEADAALLPALHEEMEILHFSRIASLLSDSPRGELAEDRRRFEREFERRRRKIMKRLLARIPGLETRNGHLLGDVATAYSAGLWAIDDICFVREDE